MQPKSKIYRFFLLVLLVSLAIQSRGVQAAPPAQAVSAYDLILAMNSLRVSNGLPALVDDPIIMAVAQGTAEIMAANEMSWHIGDVKGRLAAAGYGGGAQVWGTENFAAGNFGIDEIMIIWSDASHMIPAVNPAYCHVGAGVAKSPNGRTYYVLQAAYIAGQSCGEYKAPSGDGGSSGGNSGQPRSVPGIIVPVQVATPDSDGKIYHEVKAGQSFWAIAIAYKVTIKDIETWNNISRDSKLQPGQKLFIPSANTEGYATPTPVGMVQVSQPDKNGKIVHEVQAYNTLSTISDAYKVSVDTILALNGWQLDWPLQIGQKLLIYPGDFTPTPTPEPLTPIQKLTPEADGRYYHTIQTGETLSWIAGLYSVSVNELMAWNGLNSASIVYPEQKLLLQVTPPMTDTPTPLPVTPTSTPTPLTPTPTPTLNATLLATTPAAEMGLGGNATVGWAIGFALLAGAVVVGFLALKKN